MTHFECHSVEPHLTVTSARWAPSVHQSAGKVPNKCYIQFHTLYNDHSVLRLTVAPQSPNRFSILTHNNGQVAQEMTMTHQASQVGIIGAHSVHPSFFMAHHRTLKS